MLRTAEVRFEKITSSPAMTNDGACEVLISVSNHICGCVGDVASSATATGQSRSSYRVAEIIRVPSSVKNKARIAL